MGWGEKGRGIDTCVWPVVAAEQSQLSSSSLLLPAYRNAPIFFILHIFSPHFALFSAFFAVATAATAAAAAVVVVAATAFVLVPLIEDFLTANVVDLSSSLLLLLLPIESQERCRTVVEFVELLLQLPQKHSTIAAATLCVAGWQATLAAGWQYAVGLLYAQDLSLSTSGFVSTTYVGPALH